MGALLCARLSPSLSSCRSYFLSLCQTPCTFTSASDSGRARVMVTMSPRVSARVSCDPSLSHPHSIRLGFCAPSLTGTTAVERARAHIRREKSWCAGGRLGELGHAATVDEANRLRSDTGGRTSTTRSVCVGQSLWSLLVKGVVVSVSASVFASVSAPISSLLASLTCVVRNVMICPSPRLSFKF